jgi:hypothetical protein
VPGAAKRRGRNAHRINAGHLPVMCGFGRLLVRADEPEQVADLVVYVVSRLPA